MSKNRLLWLGYGDIAGRCIPEILRENFSVTAVCRSNKVTPADCRLVQGDLADSRFLSTFLSTQLDDLPEYIVITMTPSERSAQGYRNSYFSVAQSLNKMRERVGQNLKRLIFVSSTSVYHQQQGEWVNEESPTLPTRDTAKVLLEAERCLLESTLPVTCLRFSGIYGEGRSHLLNQVRNGVGGGEQWTNRIHSEDCAAVIRFFCSQVRDGRGLPTKILASDDEPVSARDIRNWLAQGLNLPASHLSHSQEHLCVLNKRCDNTLLKSLGYQFLYPSFREGFQQQILDFNRGQNKVQDQ